MKAFTGYTTFDGINHPSFDSAKKHIDDLTGKQLRKITKGMFEQSKVNPLTVSIWIDDHIELFRELIKIKDDMQTEE